LQTYLLTKQIGFYGLKNSGSIKIMLKQSNPKKHREQGMTLIELLMSLVIFLIGIAAIYGVTKLAAIEKNTVSTRTDQLRSARIALEYIRRDALNAGFGYHRTGGLLPDNTGNALFALPNDTDTQRDFLTSVIGGNNISANSLNFGATMDDIAFISRDASFNLGNTPGVTTGNLITYTGATASGNAVKVTTANNDCANCSKYDLYLFESASGTTQVIGMVTSKLDNNNIILDQGSDDPLNVNQRSTGNVDTQSLLVTTPGGGTIKRINVISYSITSAGVLVRKKFGNMPTNATQQVETRELVYGVSDFQIKYYMEDGTTIDDPSIGNSGRTNQLKMNSVVQIQVTITLAPDTSDTNLKVTTPITIKEFISTKNLRYEAS
jgi:prepilin-type N-terminal cleavage/methylation domain-containing protein